MKYVVLVSHGDFATGLKTSLDMLAGKRDDVIKLDLVVWHVLVAGLAHVIIPTNNLQHELARDVPPV